MIGVGSLVYLNIKNRSFTEDGLTTIHYVNNHPVLYEKIVVENYPSCNDFAGSSTSVSHGEPVIILEVIGRPHKINGSNPWSNYNIYKVQLKSGEVRNVFEYNLSKTPI